MQNIFTEYNFSPDDIPGRCILFNISSMFWVVMVHGGGGGNILATILSKQQSNSLQVGLRDHPK